jgi:predicted site-specific integrase-resolvase
MYVWIARGRLHPIPSDDGHVRIAADDLARYLTTRQTATTVGVRVDTLLGWAAAADAGEAP